MKKTVKVPMYYRDVHFVDDRDEAFALIYELRTNKQSWESDDEFDPEIPLHGWTETAGNGVVMAVFDKGIRTVVHEAVHTAGMVMERGGIVTGPDNDEPIAYLTDWLVWQWLEKMGGLQKYKLTDP